MLASDFVTGGQEDGNSLTGKRKLSVEEKERQKQSIVMK
jgi:hypothetical protein